MIGLQFIADTFHMEYKEVADKIGVSKQTFQDWIKERRKIPKQRLEQLSQLFGLSNEALFQKELLPSEKSEILMTYLTQTDESEEIEQTFVDEEGNEYTTTQQYSHNRHLIEYIHEEQKKEKLLEQIEQLLESDSDSFGEDQNYRLLDDVVEVMKEQDNKKQNLLRVILYALVHRDNNWGIHPDYSKYEPFYEKLNSLLEQFGLKD